MQNNHRFVAAQQIFEIPSKYQFLRVIGTNDEVCCYGTLIAAIDRTTDPESPKKYLIKKIRVFDDPIESKKCLREIKVMRELNHENIMKLIDVSTSAQTMVDFTHIYLVMDYMDADLGRIINSNQILTIQHIQYFLYQILRGLKYLHSADIIHCDLKPTNILINSNCDLKICGFDSVNTFSKHVQFDQHISHCHYQAPEILFLVPYLTNAVDIWATGCIFAELLGRERFFPGEDYIAQSELILRKIGCPPENECGYIPSPKIQQILSRFSKTPPPPPLQSYFPNYQNESTAFDLLKQMLTFHPCVRCCVDEALSHSFFNDLHDSNDEPRCNFQFDFPPCLVYQEGEVRFFSTQDSITQYRQQSIRMNELVWNMIQNYHRTHYPPILIDNINFKSI